MLEEEEEEEKKNGGEGVAGFWGQRRGGTRANPGKNARERGWGV